MHSACKEFILASLRLQRTHPRATARERISQDSLCTFHGIAFTLSTLPPQEAKEAVNAKIVRLAAYCIHRIAFHSRMYPQQTSANHPADPKHSRTASPPQRRPHIIAHIQRRRTRLTLRKNSSSGASTGTHLPALLVHVARHRIHPDHVVSRKSTRSQDHNGCCYGIHPNAFPQRMYPSKKHLPHLIPLVILIISREFLFT